MAELITDAELLSMGLAIDALTSIDSDVRDQARAAASDVALSYVQKRYALPLVSWGNDLKRATAHIASWDLLCRRGFNPIANSDDAIKARYDEAVKWLERVAIGTSELVDCVDATPTIEEKAPLVGTSASGPLWPNFGSGGPFNGGCCGC